MEPDQTGTPPVDEVVSEDPDGITECYSDHAHDIATRGECDWCGSTDPKVIGHILPDVQRLTDLNPVQAAQLVVAEGGCKIVDGILLDHFTASAIVAVHNALSAQGREKLAGMTLIRAADICFTLINKQKAGA